MNDILLLLTGAVLVNHLVLTQLPAAPRVIDSFRNDSSRNDNSRNMDGRAWLDNKVWIAGVTTIVMTLSSIVSYLPYHYLLPLQPLGFAFLRTSTCVLVSTAVASAVHLVTRKVPSLSAATVVVPLATINCVVLSVALITDNRSTTFVEAVSIGFGMAAAFSLALLLFSAMYERLNMGDVPAPFRGSAIALVTVALVSLAFMGFAGLV